MLDIKKCLLGRQKLECNHSGVEGSLIRPLNARFLYQKNGMHFYVDADIRKGILEECVD